MDQIDVLSDVFSTLRIESHLYFAADLGGPFSVALPAERRLIRFHLARQGRCWVTTPGGAPTELAGGDLVVVPNGAGQVLSSAPDLEPVPLGDVLATGALRGGVLKFGDAEPVTRLLCGFCQFDEAVDHPVLAALPPLMVIRARELGPEPWVGLTLRLLSMEADLDAQGTTGILARLLEIVLIQAVRRMTESLDGSAEGFMAAMSDTRLSRALIAMHAEPHRSWKVSDLARLAGMSRTRFTERFTELVGLAPMAYLTAWRLMTARRYLAASDLDMAEIAERCGYASVPSFSSRFKKAYGIGPGAFRRQARS